MTGKSRVALRQTALAVDVAKLYLWTFTFPQEIGFNHSDSLRRWRYLLKALHRAGLMQDGLRVCELHKSGALHVHVLTDRRYDVKMVRPISNKWGFGRIHVKRIPGEKAFYVCKYVTKTGTKLDRGLRVWAVFGSWKAYHVKVRDIEIDTFEKRAWKKANEAGWIEKDYVRIYQTLPDRQQKWAMWLAGSNGYIVMYLEQGLL